MKTPHKYRDLSADQIELLFSNYLINQWSFSKVSTFARNEKAFEMQYLYNYPSKAAPNTVAGQAYHKALDYYWNMYKDGKEATVVDMEVVAFEMIDEQDANSWKIQKTTPTVEKCQSEAKKTTTGLINNFLAEVQVYTSEIKIILGLEMNIKTWVTVNGVDIPLPVNSFLDMIFISKDDKRILLDHKSKRSFTSEKDMKLKGARQGMTYALAYEAETGETIDEVWFVENKYSKNRDKSPQLQVFKIILDDDTRRIYEALLYEPLKRMIEAVSNPDYIYLINDNDTFIDVAELYEFWAETMIAEVDDFNIPEDKKEIMTARLRKIRNAKLATATPNTIKNFKTFTKQFIPFDLSKSDMDNSQKIEHVLTSFGIPCKVEHTFKGYSSASYLLEMGAGVRLASVKTHRLDLANALDVSSVRIQEDLFVYNEKSYLIVESNIKRTEDLIYDESMANGELIPLGKDNFQQTVNWDLNNQSTPHMIVCGATGSGKSVFLRSTIDYAILAGVDDVFIFDPKFEFTQYSSISGVQVYSDIEEIEFQMMMLVEDMQARVRNGSTSKTLIVFDEFADAVANSRQGNALRNYKQELIGSYKDGRPKYKRVCYSKDKSLEENLKVLLQKGRSSGFRIIAATQRASTKVITGDAKVNFPVQVCFRVPKEIDSKVVIDESGAESLQGKGDGLLKTPEYLGVTRFQAFYKPV